ncbi:MAG: isoprenylcysteine carboxylmethyltransferase family protein [Synergistaceae bacterium]|nr:isoprenylcysteine carboxylmethyltransferase family protein [Synergistaceae bacterium]
MREWIFKMRGGIWTLLFIAILFMVRGTTPTVIAVSLIVVAAGQLWRCWSAASIGLYRGENVKALKLATTGPYALMRNPLYFGNFVIGLGWSLIAGKWAVIIFTLSFSVLYVMVIIPHEESFLRSKFGSEYEDYCTRVGMFWPLKINVEDITASVDWEIVKRSEVHTIISTVTGTAIIIGVSLCYT